MAFNSLSDLVKNFETGGQASPYTAYNTSGASTASGAYQFTNPTWTRWANVAGVSTALYPNAASAPAAVQDQVFLTDVSTQGLADWTCPGCNAPLTSYIAAHPDEVAGLPIASGGTATYASGGVTSGASGAGAGAGTGGGAGLPGAAGGAANPCTGGALGIGGFFTWSCWQGIIADLAFVFLGVLVFLIALASGLFGTSPQTIARSAGRAAARAAA